MTILNQGDEGRSISVPKAVLTWEVLLLVQKEAARAREKHGDRALTNPDRLLERETLAALGEEFGEVCAELTYDKLMEGDYDALVTEAVQLGHLALAIAQAALARKRATEA